MTYSESEFKRIMKNNGFVLQPKRGKGSHMVYKRDNRILTITNSYNKMVIKRLIKEYNLKV